MIHRIINGQLVLAAMLICLSFATCYFFSDPLESFGASLLLATGKAPVYSMLFLCLLLVSGILLPIPSSIAGISAGFLLGVVNGTMVCFAGMMLGCIIGYALGKGSEKSIPWLGVDDSLRMEKIFRRYGKWALVFASPIPVYAETSVFYAGTTRMHFGDFLFSTSLSNMILSMLYAGVGAYAVTLNSIIPAVAGIVLFPGIALLLKNYSEAAISRLK
ncbi:MAG: VTT domain-containing protein [Bacteroidetes bacterium]|nr:VTT domain-containing protein [Bacteroidota bacterium]